MCGFAGYFGNNINIYNLESALNSIIHRGPDESSITKGNDWAVGFNRLAILDLTHNGMQPFENNRCIVFLNGEIYNYIELLKDHSTQFIPETNSDVEIIPFLFELYGIDFLNLLNGMFSIVLIDKLKSKKYLIRDRFGKKPLFFHKSNHSIYFASEIKAIKLLVDTAPNPEAVRINLACWSLPPPFTLYKDVFAIKNGSLLEINESLEIEERNWYVPSFTHRNNEFSKDEFRSLITDSVRIRCRSDVPIGIYLSGGMDSMTIAGIMKSNGIDFTALTADIIDKEKLSGESNTDVYIPSKYCIDNQIKQARCVLDFDYWNNNILKIVRNYDELFLDSGNLVFYALGELANKYGIKVALAGVGGDELFGGYPWHSKILSLPSFFMYFPKHRKKIFDAFEYIVKNIPHGYVRRKITRALQLYLYSEYFHVTALGSYFLGDLIDSNDSSESILKNFANEIYDSKLIPKSLAGGNKINYINLGLTIANQNFKSDMGSMAYSVENRSPFLDYRIVEYMMMVPDVSKLIGGPKSLLKNFGSDFLPGYVTTAQKSGPTMPVNTWFAGQNLKLLLYFIQKNKNLTGDFLGGNFVDHWFSKSMNFADPINSIPLFGLNSLVIWLKFNVENSDAPIDVKFTDFVSN